MCARFCNFPVEKLRRSPYRTSIICLPEALTQVRAGEIVPPCSRCLRGGFREHAVGLDPARDAVLWKGKWFVRSLKSEEIGDGQQ
jgi:hypothetical protein